MSDQPYFQVPRYMFPSDCSYLPPATKYVMVELLSLCAHKPRPVHYSGQMLMLDRGDVCVSLTRLHQATGYSVKVIRTALNRLQNIGMISRKNSTKKWAVNGHEKGQSKGQTTRHNISIYSIDLDEVFGKKGTVKGKRRASKGQTNLNGIDGKDEKDSCSGHANGDLFPDHCPPDGGRDSDHEDVPNWVTDPDADDTVVALRPVAVVPDPPPPNPSADFSSWWDLWGPGMKRGRGAAEKCYKRIIDKNLATADELEAGLKRYMAHVRDNQTEARYVKHPQTWLNQACWSDDLPGPNPGKPAERPSPFGPPDLIGRSFPFRGRNLTVGQGWRVDPNYAGSGVKLVECDKFGKSDGFAKTMIFEMPEEAV